MNTTQKKNSEVTCASVVVVGWLAGKDSIPELPASRNPFLINALFISPLFCSDQSLVLSLHLPPVLFSLPSLSLSRSKWCNVGGNPYQTSWDLPFSISISLYQIQSFYLSPGCPRLVETSVWMTVRSVNQSMEVGTQGEGLRRSGVVR